MAATITVTEEAQAFFTRNPDPALRDLVDLGVKEYGEFMGSLPVSIDAFQEDDSDHVEVDLAVRADPANGSLLERHLEFMKGWRSRHSHEECRAVGFSIHYV